MTGLLLVAKLAKHNARGLDSSGVIDIAIDLGRFLRDFHCHSPALFVWLIRLSKVSRSAPE